MLAELTTERVARAEAIIDPTIFRPEIIGHGDIAQALQEVEPKGMVFFASGVSNSGETRESEFQRERELLLSQDLFHYQRLVYFGSLSTFYTYPDTPYTAHKKEMEGLVKDNFDKYCIVRLGNISWGNNPHTLINFLRGQYERGEPMNIQDTYRFVVDKNEFLYWMNNIPPFNCEMNIPGRRMKVADIVKEYVIR